MTTPVTAPKSQGHAGADAMRPVRYTGSAIKGTVTGLLDGMANLGRKGFWAGIGLGIFVGFAMPGAFIGTVAMMAVGGFALGAAAGATVGAVTGGYRSVTREARRDKYATEVAERQAARADREARTQPVTVDHRASYARRQGASNYNFERQLQQERENDRDYSTYWQDRMDGQRSNGNGRGF